ncbi:MAG: hypothetical protein VX768_09970 [Planctomycetota bacterium]|nr:hypothetical protein [Planctomycetota bacterium]
MTLLGKIFTFIILIMATSFGVLGLMVYASHRNWKEAAEKVKADYNANVTILDQQKVRIDALKLQIKQEKVARAQVISNLYAERDDLQTQNATLTTERNNLRGQAADLQTRLAQSSARVLDLDSQNLKLREEKIKLIEAIQFQQSQVVRLIDEIHQTDYLKETLRERSEQLARDIADYNRVMVAFNLTKDSLTDHIPPAIDAEVTSVSRKQKGLVQISIGSNDGMKEGHELDVVRGTVYVGRMRLTYVDANTSGGTMILQESPVRVNDKVTTKMLLKDKYSVTSAGN